MLRCASEFLPDIYQKEELAFIVQNTIGTGDGDGSADLYIQPNDGQVSKRREVQVNRVINSDKLYTCSGIKWVNF